MRTIPENRSSALNRAAARSRASLSSALFLLLVLLMMAPAAHARPNRVVVENRGYTHVVVKNSHYYYRDGYYYRRRRGAYFLAPAPIGAVVSVVPTGAIRLRFGGFHYRYFGGIYYREVPRGFVVVERPATVYVEDPTTDTQFAEPEAQTIMVKNSNGSETPVHLERSGDQWKGPRGELYDGLPTNEQLRSAYGF